jgi:hypothetical protein
MAKKKAKKVVAERKVAAAVRESSVAEGEKNADRVNKSKRVRDYVKANPAVMPRAVVDALAAEGINLSTQFVSQVKYQMRLAGILQADTSERGSGDLTVEELVRVKTLAVQLGGESKLQQALELLKKLK